MIAPAPQHFGGETIIAACRALGYEYDISSLRGPSRVISRMLIAGALRGLTSLSFPEITLLVGKKHHSGIHQQYQHFSDLPECAKRAWLDAVRAAIEGSNAPVQWSFSEFQYWRRMMDERLTAGVKGATV